MPPGGLRVEPRYEVKVKVVPAGVAADQVGSGGKKRGETDDDGTD
jgi:hypothetical protein